MAANMGCPKTPEAAEQMGWRQFMGPNGPKLPIYGSNGVPTGSFAMIYIEPNDDRKVTFEVFE